MFSSSHTPSDVTAAVGLDTLADGAPWFYTHGVAVADYDRDGWPDLLVTGYGRVALFRNEAGGPLGRRFRDVTQEAGLLGPHFWSTSGAFGDLDGDGWPELYLCQYVDWSNDNDPPCPGYSSGVTRDVCPPAKFNARPHALFRNKGDGTFEDVTAAAGLRTDRKDADYGKGLGVLFADVNDDGKPDVYVANDTTHNFLYVNRSTPGKLQFEDRGLEAGVAAGGDGMSNGSMGVDAADFDGSGRPAVWVTNYENEFHALYLNRGESNGRVRFHFGTSGVGLGAIGPKYVGFGTAFVDADSDGWEDIVITNGHVMRHPAKNNLAQRPILFRNAAKAGGGRTFEDLDRRAGEYFARDHRGRGLAVADLNNDGTADLVFANINEPAEVLTGVKHPTNHWLGVELVGRDHADVTGAKLTLAVGDRTLTRFATAGRSYLSSSDPRRLFGLGAVGKVGRLTVRWPSGEPRVEHWDGLAADQYHRVEQGKGVTK
jgi:enediyne biosynthesis protein E4